MQRETGEKGWSKDSFRWSKRLEHREGSTAADKEPDGVDVPACWDPAREPGVFYDVWCGVFALFFLERVAAYGRPFTCPKQKWQDVGRTSGYAEACDGASGGKFEGAAGGKAEAGRENGGGETDATGGAGVTGRGCESRD